MISLSFLNCKLEDRCAEYLDSSETDKEKRFISSNAIIKGSIESIVLKGKQYFTNFFSPRNGIPVENSGNFQLGLSVMHNHFDILTNLCKQKAVLVSPSATQVFENRLRAFHDNLLYFVNMSTEVYEMDIFSNDIQKSAMFHRAMIHGLLFLKKHHKQLKFESNVLAKINGLVAVSASRVLLHSFRSANRNELRLYAKLAQDALPFEDNVFRSFTPVAENNIYVIRRDCYAILALFQIDDGYFTTAKNSLIKAINEAKQAKSIGNDLMGSSVLYMSHFLERKNFSKVDEILIPLLESMTSSGLLKRDEGYDVKSADFIHLQRYFFGFLQPYEEAKQAKLNNIAKRIPSFEDPNLVVLDPNSESIVISVSVSNHSRILNLFDHLKCEVIAQKSNEDKLMLIIPAAHKLDHDDFDFLMKKLQIECRATKEKLLKKLQAQLKENEKEKHADTDVLGERFSTTLTFSDHGNIYKRGRLKNIKFNPSSITKVQRRSKKLKKSVLI